MPYAPDDYRKPKQTAKSYSDYLKTYADSENTTPEELKRELWKTKKKCVQHKNCGLRLSF